MEALKLQKSHLIRFVWRNVRNEDPLKWTLDKVRWVKGSRKIWRKSHVVKWWCIQGHPGTVNPPRCSLGVHEGHHDVSGPLGDRQALVVVGQPAGVHEGPALPGSLHPAVVAQEAAASALKTHVDSNAVCFTHARWHVDVRGSYLVVDVLPVQGDVDGEGGRVVMRP